MKNFFGSFRRNALGFRYQAHRTLCILFFLFLFSCHNQETDNSVHKGLGKYIYRDDNDIHHIDANCVKLRRGKDDAGHDIYAKHLMDTSSFVITRHEYFRVCSHCVNDSEYEHLLRISENNSITDDTIATSDPWQNNRYDRRIDWE